MWSRDRHKLRAAAVALLVTPLGAQGSALCSVDDVNGDGVRDLAVASRDPEEAETVWLFSGKDGTVLRSWTGTTPREGFGIEVARLASIESGSPDELAIRVAGGAHDTSKWTGQTDFEFVHAGRPRIVIVSPSTGKVRVEIEIESLGLCRVSFADAGDWNGDRVADVVLGLSSMRATPRSMVRVVSGVDGQVLFEHRSEIEHWGRIDHLGASIVCPGDLDGDRHPDLVVGAPYRRRFDGLGLPRRTLQPRTDPIEARGFPPGPLEFDDVGCVLVISGRTGERLAAAWGDRSDDAFGGSLGILGDVDDDGRVEIVAAATSRYVRVLSFAPATRELRVLHSIPSHCGYVRMDWFGSTLADVGDVDGDGKVDLVIGANEPGRPGFFDEGYAETWSSKTGKRIALLHRSDTERVDACAIGDVTGDRVPEVALSIVSKWPHPISCGNQVVRVVSATDRRKIAWERNALALRATPK